MRLATSTVTLLIPRVTDLVYLLLFFPLIRLLPVNFHLTAPFRFSYSDISLFHLLSFLLTIFHPTTSAPPSTSPNKQVIDLPHPQIPNPTYHDLRRSPSFLSPPRPCTRALSSPSSITASSRALILARPDPVTENDLYISSTSLPLSALVAKALATPPSLSLQEAQALVHGPVQRTPAEKAARKQAYHALTPERRSLLDRASDAVADKEEKKARNVAYRMLQSAKAEEKARDKLISTAAKSSPQPPAEAIPQPEQPPTHYRKPSSSPGNVQTGSPSSAKITTHAGACQSSAQPTTAPPPG